MSSYEDKLKSAELFIALIDTASAEKTSRIEKCLDEGANINEQFVNDSNNTPLHIAVIKKDLEVVIFLLKRGAKTNYKNQEGKTAIDIAKELNPNVVEQAIIKLLYKSEIKYQKREFTRSIKGQFYETKLITLIRIRSFIKEYDQLYLGNSLEGIGALSDICIRYGQNNKDIILFLKSKQRTEVTKSKVNAKDLWKPKGDFSLFKNFKSYLKLRERFNNSKKCDAIFNGKYEDLKCYFIIYTSAGNELKDKKTYKSCRTDKSVRDLIQSKEYSDIFQYQYTDDDVDLLTKFVFFDEMRCLGKSLFHFMKKDKFAIMLSDRNIRKYHVVLAQSVIKVSDVNSAGYRTGTFRDDFFDNNDELLVTLKKVLFMEAVKGTKINRYYLIVLLHIVVLEPTATTLSKLMQIKLIYYNHRTNTLAFTNKISKDIAKTLSEIKITYSVYKKAWEIAVKEKLNSICLKLPAKFGNIDIALTDGRRGAKRLEYLATKLEKVITHFTDKNVIISDEIVGPNKFIDAGVLDLKGGLGSAVGNLLIYSEDGISLKFNVNYNILGKYAKMLLELLKSKINDIDTYTLRLDVEGLPKLSLKASARDKLLAKDFFNNLWFYTNQAKEDEIERYSKEILQNYCITTKHAAESTATNTGYDAIYFQINDEVQKWCMISEGESNYLTNDRESFNVILRENNLLFTIINSIYIERMNSYDIKFNKVSVQSLCTKFGPASTVVITEVITLIGIKLVQHFQTLNDFAFIELDSPFLSAVYNRDVLKEEIKNKKLQTLIIIYEEVSEFKSELFRYLIKETTSKQLIIVTNTYSYQKLHHFFIFNNGPVVSDERVEFEDLELICQKKVLSSKLIFQGTEITFNTIVQEDAKYLITPCILQKIINNEILEVGRTLLNPYYDEIKYYNVDRQLSIEKESNKELFSQLSMKNTTTTAKGIPSLLNETKQIVKLSTFEDINDTVVLIGAPGIGKSTYLTHMSIKTKKQNPKIWIERINLHHYKEQFHKWHVNKTKIDRVEALKFVLKSAMSKVTAGNDINFDDIVFDLELVNGELSLRNYEERNVSDSFELQIFIYCYNKGNTVLLFEGFDEICLHYKDEITELLKCLITRSSRDNLIDRNSYKQRLWISSHSYKNIIFSLHTVFDAPYGLEELALKDLKICKKKFFKINLNLNELNYEHYINDDSFLEYIEINGDLNHGKRKIEVFRYYSFLLHELYFTAVEYFQSERNNIKLGWKWWLISKDNLYLLDWFLVLFYSYSRIGQYIMKKIRREKAMKLIITPLDMYVALDYFTNEIKYSVLQNCQHTSQWNLEANTSAFLKYFLKRHLNKGSLEQNNQKNFSNYSDMEVTLEKELTNVLDIHKRIAFYATFIEKLGYILTQVEIDEMRKILKQFGVGEEK